MKITCMIEDYSNPAKPGIRIHNTYMRGRYVELEVGDERYTVYGEELISAVKKCMIKERLQ